MSRTRTALALVAVSLTIGAVVTVARSVGPRHGGAATGSSAWRTGETRSVATPVGAVTISSLGDGVCISVPLDKVGDGHACNTAQDADRGRAMLALGKPGSGQTLVGIVPDGVETVTLPGGITANVHANVWTAFNVKATFAEDVAASEAAVAAAAAAAT